MESRPGASRRRLQRIGIGLILVTGLHACDRERLDRRPSAASSTQNLPSGHWAVVARQSGQAILARIPERGQNPATGAARAGPEVPAATEIVVHTAGGSWRADEGEVISLSLAGVPPEMTRPLVVGRATLGGNEVHFSLPNHAPALLASPVDPRLTVFEEANALWTIGPAGVVRRLTAEQVDGYSLATLSARQREGEVILYWASVPVWSADGTHIAYVTNREAVAEGGRGQSVWLLEFTTGRERPLLRESGRSFRPIGWLGAELVYISDVPGVWAIDPSTGERRELSNGVQIAAADDGSALALAEGGYEATAVRILTPEGSTMVPAAPAGFNYVAQGRFSPEGGRLLLEATSTDGVIRRFFVFDRESIGLGEMELAGLSLDSWPAWVDEETLLVNSVAAGAEGRQALLLAVP